MKSIKLFLPIIFGFLSLTSLIGTLSVTAETTAVTSDFIAEYPIPTITNSEPRNIVVESPGRVWFTMPMSNAIGSLVVTSTTDYKFEFYQSPTANSEPYDLAYDSSNGLIWFTERKGNKIGRLDIATKTMTDFLITNTVKVTPTGIAVAPNSHIWFTENGGDRIGRFIPGPNTFDEFYYQSGAFPEDIAVANNDNIWFTAPGKNRVVRYRPSLNNFSNVSVGTVVSGEIFPPGRIVIDDNGLPWITAPSKDWIGVFFVSTSASWGWNQIPTTGGRPTGIDFSEINGMKFIWFVESDSGQVGQLVTDSNYKTLLMRDTPLPSAGSQPLGIAADANGHAWITETGTNTIAEWRPPYFNIIYLPTIMRN